MANLNGDQHFNGKSFHFNKSLYSFDWDNYLKIFPATIAPAHFFNHSIDPPISEFQLNQKLEVISPDNSEMIHLATVVGIRGPRLQLRFDGCDNSNDVFKIVDSDEIFPVNAWHKINKYVAAPLRYRKDPTKYASFVKSVLQNSIAAPEHCFKKSPKAPSKNLFKPLMKLEAVDNKCPSNICPATIKSVDGNYLEIHLDGWESSNDFKVVYTSRDIFPVGWCKKTGNILLPPGPKANLSKLRNITTTISYNIPNGSTINLNETESFSSISNDNKSQNNESNSNTSLNDISNNENVKNNDSESGGQTEITSVEVSGDAGNEKKNQNVALKTTSDTVDNSEKTEISPGETISTDDKPFKNVCLKTIVRDASNMEKFQIKNSNTLQTGSDDSNNSQPKQINSKVILKIPTIKTNGQLIKIAPIETNSGDGQQKQSTSQRVLLNFPSGPNSNNNVSENISVAPIKNDGNKLKIKLSNFKNNNPETLINGDSNENSGLKRKRDQIDQPLEAKEPLSNNEVDMNEEDKMSIIRQYQYYLPTRNIIQTWSVDQMFEFLTLRFPENNFDSFKVQQIDGSALLLLNNEVMMKYLSLKLGMALKILDLIEQIKNN